MKVKMIFRLHGYKLYFEITILGIKIKSVNQVWVNTYDPLAPLLPPSPPKRIIILIKIANIYCLLRFSL